MERKLTMKEVKRNYMNIISVGYCDLCYLLRCIDREGWTSGVYGWNADVYEANRYTAIVTGYRPFGNISSNEYELNKIYNEKARKVWNDSRRKYESKVAEIERLLNEYVTNILYKKGEK